MAYTSPTLPDGTPVPSVTSIIGRNLGWGHDSLADWQMKMVAIGRDPDMIRDKAGAFGTLVHEMIEYGSIDIEVDEDIRPLLSVGDIDEARVVFSLYEKWAGRHEVEPVHKELTLASERYQYGGTVDFIGVVDGDLQLVDFKTTRSLRAKHFIQLAAYKHLYLENEGKDLNAGILHLKSDRQPVFFPAPDLAGYWNVFKHLLVLDEYREDLPDYTRLPG